MELLVAVLIALGSLTTRTDFNEDYKNSHEAEISKAKSVIDSGQYKEKDGGVIIETGTGI